MTAIVKLTEAEYHEMVDGHWGLCIVCKSFTREQTEPDAEGYTCPDCEGDCVVGAENALVMGLLEFRDSPDGDADEG